MCFRPRPLLGSLVLQVGRNGVQEARRPSGDFRVFAANRTRRARDTDDLLTAFRVYRRTACCMPALIGNWSSIELFVLNAKACRIEPQLSKDVM